MHSYLVDVARRWQLRGHVRFNSTVTKAAWNGDNERSIHVDQDMEAGKSKAYTITCSYLISAVGQLHTACVPDIPGFEEYRGKVMHTTNWDEDERLEGRRVAVIGYGAAGVQVVPEVASCAKQLTVFQRSPSWITPRDSQPLSGLQHGMVVNERVREMGAQFSKDFLAHQLPLDPGLRARLTPSYPFGCKQVLLSDDFYLAIGKAHVSLETRPIECITKNGVQVGNTEMPFDMFIFTTGFRAQSFLCYIEMTGQNEINTSSDWRHGLRAHQGVMVENLPNFAMLYGPNTNLSHVSVMLMIEAQVRYISAMVQVVQEAVIVGSSLTICPKIQAVAQYNDTLQERLNKTVFAESACRS
ncbi:hypothetical protein JMJ35_010584 [Cladonia borealis]|uniref:Monooxygenase n=1 Tax=Cladonia borealis TaxID=184061 RepID=A0AA39QS57_9LECA|nr:hypothetical protein JMJ35_010584 [Cladonia borealis]